MASLTAYLTFFTDTGSTGMFIMLVVDVVFAIWLGMTIGFGGGKGGTLPEFSKKVN
jgi:hypothetical protein